MRKAIHHLKKCDPVLRAIIERVGPYKMEYGLADFSSLAEALVYQQLNGRAAAGVLDFSRLPDLSDEEVIQHLTQVKGIGPWTAHMFLMFSLRRPNVLPTGDYGVQMALKKHYRKRKLPKPREMEKIARAWEPYRSVACWYMWRSLDIKTP